MKLIKAALLVLAVAAASVSALAGDTYVNGYVRRDGTVVQGYHRTTPDNTVNNNYGTQGNRNPYTNEDGNRPRNPSQGAGQYNYGNGQGQYNPYNTNSDD